MGTERAADLLSHARKLEQRDVELASEIDALSAMLRRVDELSGRSRRVRLGLEAIPSERDQAEQWRRDAHEREVEAREDLTAAEERSAQVGDSRRSSDEVKVEAERALRRASVAAADAAATVSRIEERLQLLSSDEAAWHAEAKGIAVEAHEVAREAQVIPRLSASGRSAPGDGLEGIEEWGARLHSALFVVRGGFESEREQVVLEANGLAAAVLGEQLPGASVALVRRRLEEAL